MAGHGLLKLASQTLWAILPEKLEAIFDVLEMHAAGLRFTREEIRAAMGDRAANKSASREGAVAVLPLYGVISPRMNMLTEMSGGTSTELFGKQFDAALADPNVTAIVLDVDSPGGAVSGVPELAAKIRAARGVKPIVAVANGLMASAAYHISSQADEVVSTPSAEGIGNIGVFLMHTDESEADTKAGIRRTIIKAGKYKAEASPYEPLTDDAKAYLQEMVDEFYGIFVRDVAKGRGVTPSAVRAGYGEGRALLAKPALDAGLVDRIATLDEVVAQYASGRKMPKHKHMHAAVGRLPVVASLADATEPAFEDGTRVRVLIGHMEGMKGKVGVVTEGHAGDPPYYAVQFDGADMPHKWLAEDELEAADSAQSRAGPAPPNLTTIPIPIAAQLGGDFVSAPVPFSGTITALTIDTGLATSTATAGGPAAVLHLVPSQSPKEHPVSDTPTAATNGAAPSAELKAVQEALARHERIDELCSLVPGVTAQEVAAYKTSGKTVEEVRKELLARSGSPSPVSITGMVDREAEKPFKSLGHQLTAIADHFTGRGTDKRLLRINAALATGSASANVPSDGGFAIQQDFSIDLLKEGFGEGTLTADASSTEVSDNADGLRVMYLEETSRATGSRWGGVQVYRGAEGDTATAKKPKWGEWEQRVHDLLGLAYVSERLLQDARALGSVFSEAFREEFAFVVDDEIIRGTGAGQCLGLINSPSLVTQDKEVGQAADTVQAENFQKMWGRLNPRAKAGAVWYINQEIEPKLQNMTIGTGTSAQLVYMPPGGISGSQYGTIYGRPVKVIEQCSAPGDVGDVFLANLKRGYKIVTKGSIDEQESIHVRFLTNERTFRWVMRIGGAPKLKSALTPYKGSLTLSDHVTLQAR